MRGCQRWRGRRRGQKEAAGTCGFAEIDEKRRRQNSTPASKIAGLEAPIGRGREGKERGVRGLPRDGVGEAIGALNREQSRGEDRAETVVVEIEGDDVSMASSNFLFICFSVFLYNF